jgi:uncharacterized integral membrane protein
VLKLLSWIVLLPLALLFIAFAVGNRHAVRVSFDPLPFQAEMSLFFVVLVSIFLGLLAGGIAAWWRAGRWRRRARADERELARLRVEVDRLQRERAAPAGDRPALPDAA